MHILMWGISHGGFLTMMVRCEMLVAESHAKWENINDNV